MSIWYNLFIFNHSLFALKKRAVEFLLRPVWIIGIEFHSNNSNLGIYQLS
jgi:hypothetical protein